MAGVPALYQLRYYELGKLEDRGSRDNTPEGGGLCCVMCVWGFPKGEFVSYGKRKYLFPMIP